MPKFNYTAVDNRGEPVSGQIEAAGVDEAVEQLTARRLRVSREEVRLIDEPAAAVGGRLTGDEAADVAVHVAELVEAAVPLAPGLRALAEELPRRRVAEVLEGIADRLESGVSLDAAIDAHKQFFPPHLRGLILAGTRSGRLPEALQQFVAFERDRLEMRHRLWLAMAYPALLFTIALGLFLFVSALIIPEFEKILLDFGAELPLLSKAMFALSRPGPQILICVPAFLLYGLLFLSVLSVPSWVRKLICMVPLVGPLWRLSGMVGFSRLMGMLLDQNVPLPDALRLTAAGLSERDLAIACRRVANRVRDGAPLRESLAEQWHFLPTLLPFVEWGQRSGALPEAFTAVAEMFQRRLRVQMKLVETVIPPILFVLVIGVATLIIGGMFMPLISLIHHLM